MTLEQELRLSYYRQVAEINGEHSIHLVQHVRSRKFFVKKCLTVYNADIYRFLQEHHIPENLSGRRRRACSDRHRGIYSRRYAGGDPGAGRHLV